METCVEINGSYTYVKKQVFSYNSLDVLKINEMLRILLKNDRNCRHFYDV